MFATEEEFCMLLCVCVCVCGVVCVCVCVYVVCVFNPLISNLQM